MTRSPRHSWLALGWLMFNAPADAAGGHFDVDDAAIVEAGHCQYETWWARAPAGAASLLHAGPGCRVGPLEVGFNYERLSSGAAASDIRQVLGPQLKWVVDPLAGPFSLGLAWSAAFDLKRGGRPAQTLYVPLTWAVNDRFAVSANLGADRDFTGTRQRHLGVSGEWVAHERFTVIGERLQLAGEWTSRFGVRFMFNEAFSLDVSAARVGPGAAHVYVVGLNHDFAR